MRYWVTLTILLFIVLVLCSFSLNYERAKNEALQAKLDIRGGYIVKVTTLSRGDIVEHLNYITDDNELSFFLSKPTAIDIEVIEVFK